MSEIASVGLFIVFQAALLSCMFACLYGTVARKNPRVATKLLTLGCALMLATVATSVMPIPSWFDLSFADQEHSQLDVIEGGDELTLAQESESESGLVSQELFPAVDRNPANRPVSGFSSVVHSLATEFRSTTDEAEQVSSPLRLWTGWLIVACCVASLLGLLRLAAGYWQLRRLFRSSRPVTDKPMRDQLTTLCKKLECSKEIEVRISDQVSIAATIGATRAVILLSADYREWDTKQLESVLIHEIAHVNHGDYARNFIAQICTALHFYNPLVHWLSGRLRLNQELVADEIAAENSASRENYMQSLVSIALQTDEREAVLAPMFLPSEKTIIRRMKMLRHPLKPAFQVPTWTFSALMIGLALVVSGLRFPDLTADPAKAILNTTQENEASLDFVQKDFVMFVVIRPSQLLQSSFARKFRRENYSFDKGIEQLDQQMQALCGLDLKDIDQISMCMAQQADGSVTGNPYLVVKSKRNNMENFKKTGMIIADDEAGLFVVRDELGVSEPLRHGLIADEKTIVWAANAEEIERISKFTAIGENKTEWKNIWNKISAEPFAMVVDMQNEELVQGLRQANRIPGGQLLDKNQVNTFQRANYFAVGLNVTSKLDFTAMLEFDTTGRAADAKETADLLLEKLVVEIPKSFSKGMAPFGELAGTILAKTKISQKQRAVTASVSIKPDIKALDAIFDSTKAAAQRTDAANRLRQLIIAMHNYHDSTRSLPPAVIVHESGKKHSWRIAMLPYLGQRELYEQYRLDEEWDSPHNSRVTAEMPDIFRHPMADESNTSCFYVVVGAATCFSGTEGTRLQDIADGTSNTIAIVEADYGVHWAKPEDISMADALINGTLGGFTETGFNVAFADGSVHFIENTTSKDILRSFFTIDGGELNSLDR